MPGHQEHRVGSGCKVQEVRGRHRNVLEGVRPRFATRNPYDDASIQVLQSADALLKAIESFRTPELVGPPKPPRTVPLPGN